jgi:hypothetical protein
MGIVPGRSSGEVAELDNYVNKLNPRHGGARYSCDARVVAVPSLSNRATSLHRTRKPAISRSRVRADPPGGLTSLSQSRYLPTLRNGPPLNLHRMRNLSCAVLVGVSACGAFYAPFDFASVSSVPFEQLDGMRRVMPPLDDVPGKTVHLSGRSVSGRDGFVWHFDGTAESVLHGRWGDAPGLFKVAGSGDRVWMVGGSGLVLFSVNQGPLKWSAAGPRVSPIRRAA